ncbi:MAG: acetyltransferase-like isoleucine patch superfamily enzyme [Candidatus Endobugula sp.]|jgi:acetyltransferase-like isoleucine patch superfamily enzyme
MIGFIKRICRRPYDILRQRKNRVFISLGADSAGANFEGMSKVYFGANVSHSSIGRGTYVSTNTNLSRSKIGRYCSIGPEVEVISGRHPIGALLSTHPAFYSTACQAGFTYVDKNYFVENVFADEAGKYLVEIGNDVWVCARVTLLAGVKIGDGAIIAAGSVVTKSVSAFSIVGGVPAKHIRFRFDEAQRKKILNDPWWKKEEKWILDHTDIFTSRGDNLT